MSVTNLRGGCPEGNLSGREKCPGECVWGECEEGEMSYVCSNILGHGSRVACSMDMVRRSA